MTNFAGGTSPSDDNVPSLAGHPRQTRGDVYADLKDFVASQTPQSLEAKALRQAARNAPSANPSFS